METRRQFLKTSAVALPIGMSAYAAGSDTLRVGMIGCGGRNTEAAGQALYADKGAKIVAMADVVMDRIRERRDQLKQQRPGQVEVPDSKMFPGFDGYKQVIEASDVVLIANAAKFHPLHLMEAVKAGKHVFVEKPHAIDPAGIKVVKAACELAKEKKLSVLSGLQSRYTPGYQETIKRVHDGAIGDIVAIQETWLRAPYVLYPRRPGMKEVEYQGSNQYHFHWLSGDDVPQTLIHNLDRAAWAMRGEVPVKCWGMGGRSTLKGEIYGSVFDHHAVQYDFANGVRLFAYCRTIPDCYEENSSVLLGTKGRCFTTDMRIEGENAWKYTGSRSWKDPLANPYQIEHVEFFKAIRSGTPLNSGDYMARSTAFALMGQFACYTGKQVTWEQFHASDFYYSPKPEDVRLDMEPPVKPGPDGIYPVFTPGETKLL
jgi:predicted dehydrogenase